MARIHFLQQVILSVAHIMINVDGYVMSVTYIMHTYRECRTMCRCSTLRCISLTLRAIVLRGRELLSNPLVAYVTVFKQHKCGSIVHAHWQIITTPFVPSSVDAPSLRAFLLSSQLPLTSFNIQLQFYYTLCNLICISYT